MNKNTTAEAGHSDRASAQADQILGEHALKSSPGTTQHNGTLTKPQIRFDIVLMGAVICFLPENWRTLSGCALRMIYVSFGSI